MDAAGALVAVGCLRPRARLGGVGLRLLRWGAVTVAVAFVPARGGSQRVPGKNVRLLSGHPLIAYSIAAALEADVFEAVVVSTDSPEEQKAFQQKYRLPFTLIADEDKKVLEAFGVPHKLGFANREAFLIRDGRIVWRDLTASTEQQAADVLAAIEELEKKG